MKRTAFAARALEVAVLAALSASLVAGCRGRDAEPAVAGDPASQWLAWERCEASRERLERCPRGTGARKRLRDDCAMSDRIARLHDPGYPRCLEPQVPRP